MSYGSIQFHSSRAPWSLDHIGFPSSTIGHVAAQDALVGMELSLLDQIFGQGKAALVVHARGSDGGTVNFGFKQVNQHEKQAADPNETHIATMADIKTSVDPQIVRPL